VCLKFAGQKTEVNSLLFLKRYDFLNCTKDPVKETGSQDIELLFDFVIHVE